METGHRQASIDFIGGMEPAPEQTEKIQAADLQEHVIRNARKAARAQDPANAKQSTVAVSPEIQGTAPDGEDVLREGAAFTGQRNAQEAAGGREAQEGKAADLDQARKRQQERGRGLSRGVSDDAVE